MAPQHALTPEFESLVVEALRARNIDLEEPRELAGMVKRLSDYFVHKPGEATPWDEPFAIPAYLAYFQTLNFVRLRAVWDEVSQFLPEVAIAQIWDFGSGLGTTQWVLESSGIAPRPLYAIETSKRARELHAELATGRTWPAEFPSRAANPGARALAVFSYSFLEMQERLPPLAQFEHLLILEPSTQSAGRDLMEWRRQLMAMGFSPLAPCTHAGECPLLVHSQRDWCHMRIHFAQPAWFERLESFLPMKNRTLTYSYLLMSRTVGPSARGARVIGDTLPENGKTKQMICRGPKREFLSWLHRYGEPPMIPHGALVDGVERAEEKGAELRVKPGDLNWR